MKRVKLIAILALVILSSTMLVACGGNGDKICLISELRTQIKQDYFNQFVVPFDNSIALSDIEIEKEYGTFSGFVVVRFNPVLGVPGLIVPIKIAGVEFDYSFASRIIAWKDGQMYTIIVAHENGSLLNSDIQNIAKIDN